MQTIATLSCHLYAMSIKNLLDPPLSNDGLSFLTDAKFAPFYVITAKFAPFYVITVKFAPSNLVCY